MLDLDKLHRNVEIITSSEYRRRPRREGWTTALSYLLLGEVEMCDANSTYMYISTTGSESAYAQRMFVEVLDSKGVTDYIYRPMRGEIFFEHTNVKVLFKGVRDRKSVV